MTGAAAKTGSNPSFTPNEFIVMLTAVDGSMAFHQRRREAAIVEGPYDQHHYTATTDAKAEQYKKNMMI
eukprot:CAMPEP_0174379418 /NCGR_PEP_ID=MMETSP0811_2-20130205/122702_1 /TAXON_ID=73025 ORGANISM="Eutreptiella gymnastica-like, Strain CCMP1594" /NCGR_SAMPLE_ID=MMETSP0811_2 /ASSEMBLY_ACC=CAM_ASM_000667 /LENGTH=68 /DNA_ID=CAMNT_0015531957 /DNA_START=569 /DNA_END=775 /DNA_ORIENTATION=+